MATTDIFEAMSTLRSVRLFDERPISDDDLGRIMEMTTKAANGSNQQTWRFLVIKDAEMRRQVGGIYLQATLDQVKTSTIEEALAAPGGGIMRREVLLLARDMGKAPVHVFCCDLGTGMGEPPSSIFPAAQNLMLAAWSFGIGTVLTTIWKNRESEMRRLLGVPDDIFIACLIPLGHPARPYGPPRRAPWQQVTFLDRWEQPVA